MNFETQNRSLTSDAAFDAVLVAGGGVRHDGNLPPWVELRLQAALNAAPDKPILTLSAGTTHKAPPLDRTGRPIFESVAMARWLQTRGYPAELLWPETASYDTIGNAFFARTIHLEPAGLRNLLVITSSFHMPRTEKIFRWIFSLDPPAPAFHLTFLDTANTGVPPEILTERIGKEKQSLAALDPLVAGLRSMASVHRWLFTDHSAYAIAKSCPTPHPPGNLLDSY